MMAKDYLIKGVDPTLYKYFKAACAYYELTINEVFVKHMENIVNDYLRAVSEFDKAKVYTHKKGKKK